MSDTDNYLKLLEKLSEVSSTLGVLNNEISHLKQDMSETKAEMAEIKRQDIEQNRLLDEHILGVKTNMERLNEERAARLQEKELIQKQIQELDVRLKKAEFVPNLISHMRTALIWIGGACTAIGAIAGVLKLFGQI